MDYHMNLRSRKLPTLPTTSGPRNPAATCTQRLDASSPRRSQSDPRGQSPPNPNPPDLTSMDMAAPVESHPIVIADTNNDHVTPPSGSAAVSVEQLNGAGISASFPNLELYFRETTNKFENMIRKAVDSFIAKLEDLESSLGASLEFERRRIDTLQSNQDKMMKQINDMEKEMSVLKSQIAQQEIAANKSERFSRRNNIRLVGIPEPAEGHQEDCIQIIEKILQTRFSISSKVERAHRDGKKVEGRPRHILIKLLSYRDKVDVMRKNREALKDDRYFIVDDLTPVDLREKQKHSKQVQDLYKAGTKLRFYAGKWRKLGGTPYNFD